MPITQDRMMRLLTTTENVLRLYERGTEFIVEVAATQSSPGGPIFEANAEFNQLPNEATSLHQPNRRSTKRC
jgi:hypothetical protein